LKTGCREAPDFKKSGIETAAVIYIRERKKEPRAAVWNSCCHGSLINEIVLSALNFA